ncbi:MAG: GNAT family N-acetyltransferase, partial [Candidatus Aenigmarchaeota archaeon]|nr:GNAT family N-acetyltransferase [Candidatus Aenigmarchaeota archaeon]
FRPEIDKDSALIRELKVVGATIPVGEKGEGLQHKGLGSELMAKAEEIARSDEKKKIVVISAVGTRKYYEKLGYVRDGPYYEQEGLIILKAMGYLIAYLNHRNVL